MKTNYSVKFMHRISLLRVIYKQKTTRIREMWRQMKKFLILLLLLGIVFSGCGGKDENVDLKEIAKFSSGDSLVYLNLKELRKDSNLTEIYGYIKSCFGKHEVVSFEEIDWIAFLGGIVVFQSNENLQTNSILASNPFFFKDIRKYLYNSGFEKQNVDGVEYWRCVRRAYPIVEVREVAIVDNVVVTGRDVYRAVLRYQGKNTQCDLCDGQRIGATIFEKLPDGFLTRISTKHLEINSSEYSIPYGLCVERENDKLKVTILILFPDERMAEEMVEEIKRLLERNPKVIEVNVEREERLLHFKEKFYIEDLRYVGFNFLPWNETSSENNIWDIKRYASLFIF